MKNYYKLALANEVPFEGEFADDNAATAMVWKGISRGRDRQALYRSGISGTRIIDVVGATELFEHGIMRTVTDFLVDLAHILLMVGGLYLLASSMGWARG